MATKEEEERPVDPEEMLPEDSVLSFEEYMEMQRSIGEETRYRILFFLHHHGEKSPKALRDSLELAGNTLHHHLNKLVEVGLVQKRARKEADSEGLFTYYRASGLGRALLEHGVTEVMQLEHEYRDMYASE